MMTTPDHWESVLAKLDQYRAALLGQVADQITFTIPLLGVPPTAADPVGHHQRQMHETAARLHDSLQAGRLAEQLLAHEFTWAARVLPRWGLSAEHVDQLIDTYIDSALLLGAWSDEERVALEEIRAHLRGLVAATFPGAEGR